MNTIKINIGNIYRKKKIRIYSFVIYLFIILFRFARIYPELQCRTYAVATPAGNKEIRF